MKKYLFFLLIISAYLSCNQYEVLATQITFQGHLREDGNNRPLSNFKVNIRHSDYGFNIDKGYHIENEESIQFDSTFTNDSGDFLFEIPFTDFPPRYYELTITRPGFLDYTSSHFFREYHQIDTLTIGNSTRFELALEFGNLSTIEFSLLGYESREAMEEDRPDYRNYTNLTRLGTASFVKTSLAKNLPYDDYAYLILVGVNISEDPAKLIINEEFAMLDGGIIQHHAVIDD